MVKPVTIRIRSDEDMDMFLAMRVDLQELKLYVVTLLKHMNLEVDDFSAILVTHGWNMQSHQRTGHITNW